ncbi:glycoside hydrolase family 66 protein [Radiobacillus sp. PE A8.2]|uniref:glycoside hydrolase family 66 protein n=1 Tax=Radiobacillus sp. PE A8.2 TaxID=3380349 RepID=UPI00388FA814
MKNIRQHIFIIGSLFVFFLLVGCTEAEDVELSVTADTIEQGKWLGEVTTDLAKYEPGDTVNFTLSLTEEVKGKVFVQYKHLNEVVAEQNVELKNQNEITWKWTPGEDDFTGYLAEVFLVKSNEVVDHLNIGVDVSSDWGKFPRYGYLADYYVQDEAEQKAVIDNLNRFHINGIQFYDWQWYHEKPVKTENGEVASEWKDIANRIVYRDTVQNYINLAHEKNMKAMNYNLLFGASEDYEQYGIKKEWGLFKDQNGNQQDVHPLPTLWAYDIQLFNPGNANWQEAIFESQKEVFDKLGFDGWHVDQLGDRSPLWTANGTPINLAQTYRPFLENAKETLDVDLVLNAVSQYGQQEIAKSPVEFLYTESWDEPLYQDLKHVIDNNWEYSNGELNTVLAAYMNYDLSDSRGYFNTPGILYTNATIFAAGGAHLELGENMLSKEYFPHKTLEITDELRAELIRYYDFMVAYQNLLRDGAVEIEKEVTSDSMVTFTNEAQQGAVWYFAKQKDNKEILHFLNYSDVNSMEWKDTNGTQPEPELLENISVTMSTDKEVANVWMATPDGYNGSSVALDFEQEGNSVSFNLPSLKYWNMVVIEYK